MKNMTPKKPFSNTENIYIYGGEFPAALFVHKACGKLVSSRPG